MHSLFFLYLSEQIYKIMKIKLLLISFLLAANALGAAAQQCHPPHTDRKTECRGLPASP